MSDTPEDRPLEIHDSQDVARAVLGDEQVDETNASINDFNASWHEHLARAAGSIWTRGGIDHRTRSFITLALLTALGREEELGVHVRVALRNGLTPEEISEALIHTSLYAGVPFVRAAFRIADRVLAESEPESESIEGVTLSEISVAKSVDLPVDPATAWKFVSDYSRFDVWQPHIRSIEMLPNGDRKVFFSDGDVKVDRIVARDDEQMILTYEMVPDQAPAPGAPVLQIVATFTVRPTESGCEVEYGIVGGVPDGAEAAATQGVTSNIDGALTGLRNHLTNLG
jgi:4-carboxymuconolactone decarboxylase